jgi:hypothetical protein
MLPVLHLPAVEPAGAIGTVAVLGAPPAPSGRHGETDPGRSRPARMAPGGCRRHAVANSRAKLVFCIESGSFRRSSPSLTGSFSGISPQRFNWDVRRPGANLRLGGTWAGRSAGNPAVGQALRRHLAFFVAPLVAVFLPTVLR